MATRPAKPAARKFNPELPTDEYVLNGVIDHETARTALNEIGQRPRATQAKVYLHTPGGIPGPAFVIMRALQHAYEGHLTAVVPGMCKSAGTLMVLGADELAMGGKGELGPLDLQVRRENDDRVQHRSVLTPQWSLTVLGDQTIRLFREAFRQLKYQEGLSTSTAVNAATALAVGVHSPLFAQLDPMMFGEFQLITHMGEHYARRLMARSGNVLKGGLENLFHQYGTHDFAIDREEAKGIFRRVRHLDESEQMIGRILSTIIGIPGHGLGDRAMFIRCGPDEVVPEAIIKFIEGTRQPPQVRPGATEESAEPQEGEE